MFTLAAFVVGGDRAGALARRARAAGDVARAGAARVRLAGAPQPPPLRRLLRALRDHHAVRRRGRVLELQERPGRALSRASPSRWATTRSRTSSRSRSCTRPPTGGSSGSRSARSSRCARTAGEPKPLRTSKDYFPSQDRRSGPVSRFFDGETHDRGRPRREPVQRHLGRRRAGHREDPPAHRGGRPAVRQGRRRPDRRAVERVPRAGAARARPTGTRRARRPRASASRSTRW